MKRMGTIRDGKVILDDGAQLPEGSRVEVSVVDQDISEPTLEDCASLREFLLSIAGTVNDLRSDMVDEHDHYIHGTPKRKGRVT